MAIFQDGLVPGNMQVSLGGQIVNDGSGAGAVDFTVGVGFTAARTGAASITGAPHFTNTARSFADSSSVSGRTGSRV